MASFPQMKYLPPVLDSTGWTWERYSAPSGVPSDNFWLGFDLEGNRWLTKLRGSFYAYREIVFSHLAQKMGWSCQSSSFLRLNNESAKVLGVSTDEVHAAHWFMDEHIHAPCSPECSLEFMNGRSVETVDDLRDSEIDHLLDWPKSEFAAFLFGANELPGRLFTTAHEFVIIDSEQMFSTDPCSLDGAAWWKNPDGHLSLSGQALALEVCHDLCALSTEDLDDALSIPITISVRKRWLIEPKLKASRKFATQFCASHARV